MRRALQAMAFALAVCCATGLLVLCELNAQDVAQRDTQGPAQAPRPAAPAVQR